jgi:hypothetical protein
MPTEIVTATITFKLLEPLFLLLLLVSPLSLLITTTSEVYCIPDADDDNEVTELSDDILELCKLLMTRVENEDPVTAVVKLDASEDAEEYEVCSRI